VNKYLRSNKRTDIFVLALVGIVGISVFIGLFLTGKLSNNEYIANDNVNATVQQSEVTSEQAGYPLEGVVSSKDSTAGLSVPDYFEKIGSPESVYDIIVDEGQLISGPSEIRIKKDTAARVNIFVKEEEARLRLEGYEIITESDLPSPGGFSFIANKTGDFKFYVLPEDEHEDMSDKSPIQIGRIIVQ